MTLRLDHASLNLGGRRVLDGCTLHVEPGRIHALLGPNGAGKTSALRLLAGDLPPTTGAATLDDRSMHTWPAAALATRRAVLTQRPALDFAFTVREVVAMGRTPWKRRSDAVVDDALAAFDLTTLADRPFTRLSGGQQQRVHLARVIAQVWPADDQPRFALLDEPTASMDLRVQHAVLASLRALAARGLGVLWVVHDINLAARHADALTLLADGRCVAQGPVATALSAQALQATFGLPVRAVGTAGGRPVWLPVDPADSLRQT